MYHAWPTLLPYNVKSVQRHEPALHNTFLHPELIYVGLCLPAHFARKRARTKEKNASHMGTDAFEGVRTFTSVHARACVHVCVSATAGLRRAAMICSSTMAMWWWARDRPRPLTRARPRSPIAEAVRIGYGIFVGCFHESRESRESYTRHTIACLLPNEIARWRTLIELSKLQYYRIFTSVAPHQVNSRYVNSITKCCLQMLFDADFRRTPWDDGSLTPCEYPLSNSLMVRKHRLFVTWPFCDVSAW